MAKKTVSGLKIKFKNYTKLNKFTVIFYLVISENENKFFSLEYANC